MNVMLTISTLAPGGAERVMSALANHWAGLGWRVHLVVMGSPSGAPYFPLDPKIDLRWLHAEGDSRSIVSAAINNLHRILALRRAMRQIAPDVVLSFIDRTNVTTLIAARGLALPVIAAERTDPRQHDPGWIWSWLRWRTYPWSFRVVAQTQTALSALPASTKHIGIAIANPIVPGPIAGLRPVIVGVGRLVPVKGFERLIEAFAQVAPHHPSWSLVIWGEGPQRAMLEALRDRLGLGARARLPGLSAKPGGWLREAGVLALSSRYEGFPNVIGEAMAAGLPVVAMNCPSGPAAMIDDGVDGLLVPADDVSALALALDRLMSDEALRHRLGQAARHKARQWAPERIFAQWTAVMLEAVGKRP